MSGDGAGAGAGQRADAQPAPAQPAGARPGPAQPAPVDPAPVDPAPVDPAAVDPAGAQGGPGHKGKSHGGVPARGWDVPWAESPTTGTGAPGRAELELAFATAMRRTGSLMQLMGQAAADRIGINATDLNCLNILSFSGHMTAGELARATG